MTPLGLFEAATDTRRHYTRALVDSVQPIPGGFGVALCSSDLIVRDSAARAGWAHFHGLPAPRLVADLPLCRRCERKAAKR